MYAAKASSAIVLKRSGLPLTFHWPGVHSRSSGEHSSRCAARWRVFSLIFRDAIAVAAPAVGVERDAYVPRP